MNIPLFDAHCDTAFELFCNEESLYSNKGHIDLKRAKEYMPYAQFFAIFVMTSDEYPERAQKLKDFNFEQIFKLEVENLLKELQNNSDFIILCRNAREIDLAAKQGKAAALLSVEGAEALGCSIKGLHDAYDVGVRAINPVWNRDNLLCGCAASGENIGLTGAGRDFVCEAERLGIIIDVSHMSEKGFWDLCEVLNGPFMAGHSNSKKICPHPRNLTDEQFCEIVKRGGVAGINLYTEFLAKNATLYDVIKHIEHFMSLGGEKNIALGGDLDGCDSLPEGLGGIEDMGNLYELLLRENYREDVVRGIFYNNMYEMVEKICGI